MIGGSAVADYDPHANVRYSTTTVPSGGSGTNVNIDEPGGGSSTFITTSNAPTGGNGGGSSTTDTPGVTVSTPEGSSTWVTETTTPSGSSTTITTDLPGVTTTDTGTNAPSFLDIPDRILASGGSIYGPGTALDPGIKWYQDLIMPQLYYQARGGDVLAMYEIERRIEKALHTKGVAVPKTKKNPRGQRDMTMLIGEDGAEWAKWAQDRMGYFHRNPRKAGTKKTRQGLLPVPRTIARTPRSAAAAVTVYPGGRWPIGDLYHARLALMAPYAMSPSHVGQRVDVVRAVQQLYPQYDWASWWDGHIKRRGGQLPTWKQALAGHAVAPKKAAANPKRARANRGGNADATVHAAARAIRRGKGAAAIRGAAPWLTVSQAQRIENLAGMHGLYGRNSGDARHWAAFANDISFEVLSQRAAVNPRRPRRARRSR